MDPGLTTIYLDVVNRLVISQDLKFFKWKILSLHHYMLVVYANGWQFSSNR